MNWRLSAACRDWPRPEDFFPLRPGVIPPEVADLCASCPVTDACRDLAERTRARSGIYAGECFEARYLQRRRKREPADAESAA